MTSAGPHQRFLQYCAVKTRLCLDLTIVT